MAHWQMATSGSVSVPILIDKCYANRFDLDEGVGLMVGQRPQQDGVDEAERRDGRADAQR